MSAQPLPIGAFGMGIDNAKITFLPQNHFIWLVKYDIKVWFNIVKYYHCPLNPKTTLLTFRETEVWFSAYHGQAPFVKK